MTSFQLHLFELKTVVRPGLAGPWLIVFVHVEVSITGQTETQYSGFVL